MNFPRPESRLIIGTSGWSYADWKGSFYPKDVPQRKFLEYYATRFPATELNASFYRLPTDKMLDAWLERTSDEFRFCAKLSRLITHQKKLNDPADALGGFFGRFEPLLGRMGPALAQLPPSLAFDSDRVEMFLAAYRDASDLPLAIEARHESWFDDEALDLLKTHKAALVQAESGGRWPETDAVTADFVYLRLHGPQELYASGYTPQKLGHVAGRVAGYLRLGMDVYAFFNNTDGGYAWRNAEKLAELVKKRM
jgi:uncharacterized protein YecE (DUF72 family)